MLANSKAFFIIKTHHLALTSHLKPLNLHDKKRYGKWPVEKINQ
jgi:hypothetical protein